MTTKLVGEVISHNELEKAIVEWLQPSIGNLKKILILPPDFTRAHSLAGTIVQYLYKLLSANCQIDIMPALGTHVAMSTAEIRNMYGSEIPLESFLVHDWRNDVIKIGEIPADYLAQVSDNRINQPIAVELNRKLFDPTYDLIISIGQVVPHEVVGMANYNKNIFVGCGGKEIINLSHFLGAVHGMERLMGRDNSPVRNLFDYAEKHFLNKVPLCYVLTVTTTVETETHLNGLFIGRDRTVFEAAVKESQKRNINLLNAPIPKVVVYLDPEEFKSTWLGNKAIYRSRMAIKDCGDLIIIAPGLKQFGEDKIIDQLIRKYGYIGTESILELVEKEEDLQNNLSAAAHLIHGSSEGRFKITYAPGFISQAEIESVNYSYMPLEEALRRFPVDSLKDGFNELEDGERIFFVRNPALGLWALQEQFQ